MRKSKTILVLNGPSGSGKSTISHQLADNGIPKCITATTRPKREGEVNGIDYHFLTEEEFAETVFVEQTTYCGYRYGLPVFELEDKWKESNLIQVVMDKAGVTAIKEFYPKEAIVLYIPISEELMRSRMELRGDSFKSIESRIEHAHENGEFLPPREHHWIIDTTDETTTNSLLASF